MTINQKISIPLFLLAVAYIIASILLPKYDYILIDADGFPLILGGFLLVLSVLLFFNKEEEDARVFIAREDLKIIGIVVALILLYIVFLEPLGFVISTALFIFICSFLLGYRNNIVNSIVSLLFPITFYLLFTRYLMISLPAGVLPF
ncbi:tripartite tricarboxylate transporter TctB family protein [Oceanobacillus polygoni]|uniref:Tricarboxylic transport membrane protein n=1 Tax=Oceanobacillus polygoni TaxID=1235259 RepID=A0A9X0YQM0_9BACI|nr:tripartite tricarboxylate transporter TctB family protein [Oceanobacillus polygoni]MBP2076909.1 putative tricarboxylic transport membrane protein [Oceanobacillus polygoni]